MKKIISFLVTLFLVTLTSISFCSCGSDDDDTPSAAKEITVIYTTHFNLNLHVVYSDTQKVPADSLLSLVSARVKTLIGGDSFKMASDDGKKPTDAAIATLKNKLSSDAEIIRLKKEVLSIMDDTGKVTLFTSVYVKLVDKAGAEAWTDGDINYWIQKIDL